MDSAFQRFPIKCWCARFVGFNKFTDIDWEPFISYELRPDREKPFIDVGAVIDICAYEEGVSIEDLIDKANMKDQVEEIRNHFKSQLPILGEHIDEIGFWKNPDSKGFYRILKKQRLQIFLYYRLHFNHIDSVLSEKYIFAMADISQTIVSKYYKLIKSSS